MSDRIAILIVNYNMPERTNALCAHINQYVKWPHELIVIDNGSDQVKPSRYTNLWLPDNRQTTNGWIAGLKFANAFGDKWLGYWFIITSAEFVEPKDGLAPMAQLLLDYPSAVGVHPALTTDSTTTWRHLITRDGREPRQVKMIDNIAALWRADWFDKIGWFDKNLTYAWGIDLETCYLARQQERGIYVHEGSRIKKVTNIGYKMNRMGMTATERGQKAYQNMAQVLSEKYGDNWHELMYGWQNEQA